MVHSSWSLQLVKRYLLSFSFISAYTRAGCIWQSFVKTNDADWFIHDTSPHVRVYPSTSPREVAKKVQLIGWVDTIALCTLCPDPAKLSLVVYCMFRIKPPAATLSATYIRCIEGRAEGARVHDLAFDSRTWLDCCILHVVFGLTRTVLVWGVWSLTPRWSSPHIFPL